MKVVLQKVKKASVSVDNKIVGEIDKGYCLLVGVHKDSTREDANRLYEEFNEHLREEGIKVETGIFQTMMEVNIVNDGPVTIIYEKISVRK